MRRLVGVVALVCGIGLVVGVLAGGGFQRAGAAQRLTDQARPAVGRSGIVKLRADTDLLLRVGNSILTEAVPALANELAMSPQAFNRLMAERYPNLAAANGRSGEIGTALNKTVTNLEAHTDDFEDADAIPLPGAPVWLMPAFGLLAGIVLAAGGALALRTPMGRAPSRGPLLAVAAVGLILAAGTLAIRLPQKSASAERLLGSLTTTEENARRTREQFDLAEAAVDDIETKLLPDVSGALGVSPEQLVAALANRFPALAELGGVDAALANIEGDVRFREQRLDDFARVNDVPFAAMSWATVGLGAALAVLAALALRASARQPRADADGPATDAGEPTAPLRPVSVS